MEFDDFLKHIGQFGRYQQRLYSLLCVVALCASFNTMGYVFLAAVPNHWCKAPDILGNLSAMQRRAILPPSTGDGEVSFDQCSMYNFSGVELIYLENADNNSADAYWYKSPAFDDNVYLMVNGFRENVTSLPIIKCSEWEYDDKQYTETIISKWNLVCGQEMIGATVGSIYAIGKIIGCILFGYISDRFGRRRTLLATTFVSAVFGIGGAFAPEPISYIIGRFFLATSSTGMYEAAFVLGVELVGPSWREFAGIAINFFWAFGFLLLALLAYFIRDWFTLQLVTMTPALVLFFLYAWLIPESPRWLLRVGRESEAHEIMQKMADMNGKEIDQKILTVEVSSSKKTVKVSRLLKSDAIVASTIISAFVWFCTSLVYYGLSMNTSNLGGNPFVNFAISGAVEIPAYCLSMLLLYKAGRRWSHVASFIASGLCLMATIPVPSEYDAIAIAFSMLGKFAISSGFAMIYIYTAELYATTTRTFGIGFSSTCARIGMFVAPYVSMLGNVVFKELPQIIFGTFSLLAGLACLLLPETKWLPLPDTIDDLHNLQSTQFFGKSNTDCPPTCEQTEESESSLLEQATTKDV